MGILDFGHLPNLDTLSYLTLTEIYTQATIPAGAANVDCDLTQKCMRRLCVKSNLWHLLDYIVGNSLPEWFPLLHDK